jgi:translation initiation factor IF-3
VEEKGISTKKKERLNTDIRAPEIRLIGSEGEQLGIVSGKEALDRAVELGLDLVEISPTAKPPVCKIMDYGKFQFQLSKKQVEAKKKQKRIQVKRIRIRPGIEAGDYQVKLRNLTRFLEHGDKVEISIRFRGREMSHKELGMELLQRMRADLIEYADIELEPKFEGRQMMMIVVPKKK